MARRPATCSASLISLLAAGGLVVGGVARRRARGRGRRPVVDVRRPGAERAEVVRRGPAAHPPRGATGRPSTPRRGAPRDGHVHDDPTTKNAISRSGEAAAAPDRTTPAQRAASRARVAAQRTQREPRLAGVPLREQASQRSRRACTPWPGGCYSPRRRAGSRSRRPASAPTSSTRPTARSSPRRGPRREPRDRAVTARGLDGARRPAAGRFTFTLADGRCAPAVRTAGFATGRGRRPSRCVVRPGCTAFPEVEHQRERPPVRRRLVVPGGPRLRRPARARADPRVPRRPGDLRPAVPPLRRTAALVDCPDHRLADGSRRGARGRARRQTRPPATTRSAGRPSPTGPTRTRSPTSRSTTSGSSARGAPACASTPACSSRTRPLHGLPAEEELVRRQRLVRLQAKGMREMQDYIDAQYGGPGGAGTASSPTRSRPEGDQRRASSRWSWASRTSVPLGCNVQLGAAHLHRGSRSTRELAEMTKLGVSQMELDQQVRQRASPAWPATAATTGTIDQQRQLPEHRPLLGACRPAHAAPRTSTTTAGHLTATPAEPPRAGRDLRRDRQLFGARRQPCPCTRPARTATSSGLSPLGEHLDQRDDRQGDHLRPRPHERQARNAGARHLEARAATPASCRATRGRTPDAYPRIYKLGGFIAPYAGDSTGFVRSGAEHLRVGRHPLLLRLRLRRRHQRLRREGRPARRRRGEPGDLPVQGPRRRHGSTGSSAVRVYDVNTDGVAHYGLYPDWIEDLEHVARCRRAGARGRHGARPRGVPADLGARVGPGSRLVPQPGTAGRP